MRNTESPARLSSVANAMLILKSFSASDGELGIIALATRLGLAKSTVHRLASTLMQAGMLEQNPANGKYRLGITAFELGSLARSRMDFYGEAKDTLRALREKTTESVHLAVLRGESVIYLNSLESHSAIKVTAPLGKRVSAHTCVEGKVLLAFSEPQAIEAYLRGARNVDVRQLRTELASVLERGYAIGNEEAAIGVRAIAAPFFGGDNDVVGAIGLAGPATRLTRRSLMSFLPILNASTEALSSRLGSTRALPVGGLRLVQV
jgi:IclR family transcriptional regulator, KDG regulon repressor